MLEKFIKSKENGYLENFLFGLLCILFLLWNVPHTIAARYICEFLALTIIFYFKPPWRLLVGANKPLIIFIIYLPLQLLFFSENYETAFINFRSEWMHFIIFSIIGLGAGHILVKKFLENSLFYFGISMLIPLIIFVIFSVIKGIEIGNIPWGFILIYEHRGIIGYAALQAVLFLCPFFFSKKNSIYKNIFLIFALLICLSSTLISLTRGGLLFVITSIIVITTWSLAGGQKLTRNKNFYLTATFLAFLSIWFINLIAMSVHAYRWTGIYDQSRFAMQGSPVTAFCDGIEAYTRSIKSSGQDITPKMYENIQSIKDGDGARIMALRSGAQLILLHPMGIDQSRQAFQMALKKYCGGNPRILISHSHNGWINTSLAIGIPGAFLLLLAFLQYARIGLKDLRNNLGFVSIFGLTLFSSALIYIIRGIFDATLQDQMLETQAFVLAFLMSCTLVLKRKEDDYF